jgi:hypothetical protein
MLIRSISLLSLLASVVLADVQFVKPTAGASISGGGSTLSVSWEDSGDDPPLSSLTTYTLFLCAGGNDAASQKQIPLGDSGGQGKFSDGNEASGKVDANFGASLPNAYFLKMISTGPGGTVTNYSPRFSLTGMKGTFPAAVLAGIQKVSGTDGPPTEKMGGNLPKTGVNAPSESFAIPFASQTGAIFYAPMQKRPGTKITAKDAKPLYPTSSVTLATGFLPTPKQTTTFTATMTISTESRAHTASPAAQPKDDMQKFLERWRD